MTRPMSHPLFVALVAGTFACAVGAAHAQQSAPQSPPAATSPAPAEAPDSQGHDVQTGKPETAHTTSPRSGTNGQGTQPSGKSADETSGKMDDGTSTQSPISNSSK